MRLLFFRAEKLHRFIKNLLPNYGVFDEKRVLRRAQNRVFSILTAKNWGSYLRGFLVF